MILMKQNEEEIQFVVFPIANELGWPAAVPDATGGTQRLKMSALTLLLYI